MLCMYWRSLVLATLYLLVFLLNVQIKVNLVFGKHHFLFSSHLEILFLIFFVTLCVTVFTRIIIDKFNCILYLLIYNVKIRYYIFALIGFMECLFQKWAWKMDMKHQMYIILTAVGVHTEPPIIFSQVGVHTEPPIIFSQVGGSHWTTNYLFTSRGSHWTTNYLFTSRGFTLNHQLSFHK